MEEQPNLTKQMNLMFIGVGSAFTLENFQSNAVLTYDNRKLLIDAGGDVRKSLKAAGIGLHELDAIYVSHLHSDHWGGAEYLAYATYFNPSFVSEGSRRRLKLYAHPAVANGLFDSLRNSTVLPDRTATLDDYFDLQPTGTEHFAWHDMTFRLVQTTHVLNNGVKMPCFGISWLTPSGRTVWYSADALLEAKQALFEEAAVIFHDCETGFKTGVHAHYDQLLELPEAVRRKIVLYHYNDGAKDDCVARGFAGWAEQGIHVSLP